MSRRPEPISTTLVASILILQIYTSFIRGRDADDVLIKSDAAYQEAVFASSENKGVMHQVFRQNEVDRELLKYLVRTCGR